jgi:branched-chain amino acid transport system substrate-binding protein
MFLLVCVGERISILVGQADRVIHPAIRQQPGIRGDRGTTKLEHQTAIEIKPQRTPIRFTRRVPSVPAAKAVVDKFTAEGYNPEGYTLYTYAAIQAFAAAANKAESVKIDDLSKALKSMTVDTVKGDVTDPKYVFYVWKDGKYAQM